MEATFGNGIELLFLGMGGVFIFLIILVCLMNVSASFFKKYAHLFPEEAEKTAAPKKPAASGNDDIAIVMAAITSYNK